MLFVQCNSKKNRRFWEQWPLVYDMRYREIEKVPTSFFFFFFFKSVSASKKAKGNWVFKLASLFAGYVQFRFVDAWNVYM